MGIGGQARCPQGILSKRKTVSTYVYQRNSVLTLTDIQFFLQSRLMVS